MLKAKNNRIILFFVTSHKEYMDDSMDVRAFRFFDKPIEPARLLAGLNRAMEYIDETYLDFYLCTDNTQMKIQTDEVYYVERANRRVKLVTARGEFYTRETFDHWKNLLQNSFFYQVHKSYIVNFHYVTRYEYSALYLGDDIRIPIASMRQTACHRFWIDYMTKD